MTLLNIICPLIAFIATYFLIPFFRKIAFIVNLTDKPNARKVHANPVPLVGGISVFLAASIVLFISTFFLKGLEHYKSIYFAIFILLSMGVVDDMYDLRATLKLAIQILLAHFMIAKGIKIESLYGLFQINELSPWMQYTLTMIVIVGVINAFNLMDGIDGLAAGLAIVGFAFFAFLSVKTGQYLLTLIFLTFIGSLIAFLRYNLSKERKIFMGDAGSLMIGFMMVIAGIQMIQSAKNTEHINLVLFGVVSVMLVPVFDALRVFRRRMKSGRSPFSADKTHLHHLILSTGLKHKSATAGIIGIVILMLGIGAISFQVIGLTFSIVIMLLLFSITTSILKFQNKINMWKKLIRELEESQNK